MILNNKTELKTAKKICIDKERNIAERLDHQYHYLSDFSFWSLSKLCINSQYRYDWTVLLQIFVLIELNGYKGKEAVKANVSITVTNRGEIQSSTVHVKNCFPFATTFTLCLDCKKVRIFAYSGTRLKAKSETGERRGCETRAPRDFEKKILLCSLLYVLQ